MKIFFVLAYILITVCTLNAQFHKEWEFTLEGNGHNPFSYGIRHNPILKTFETVDGDFITVSVKRNITPEIYTTIYLYRFTPAGQVIWEYEYESPYKIKEEIHGANMDPNGNVYIAAETTTKYTGGFEPQESTNVLILKISPQGELLWSYESPPPPANWYVNQVCKGVETDPEGNLYTAIFLFDTLGSYILIQKRDNQGSIVWQNSIPYKYFVNLKIINSKLIVIASFDGSIIYHFNLQDGEIEFTQQIPKKYVGEPTFDSEGNWYNLYPTGKFKIDKRNIFGDTLWSFYYPTNLPGNVWADEIEDYSFGPDGSLYITGRHYGPYYGDTSQYSNCDVLTLKLDKNGNPIWSTRYQYNDLQSCQVGKRIITNAQGLTFVGGYQSVRNGPDPYASYDLMILVYDPTGALIDSIYYDSPSGKEDEGVNLILAGDALYLLGWTEQNDSLFDQTIVKYNYHSTVHTNEENSPTLSIFPNPTYSGQLSIRCEESPSSASLFDAAGQLIFSSKALTCNSFLQLPPHLPAGCYYLKLQWPTFTRTVPVVMVARD